MPLIAVRCSEFVMYLQQLLRTPLILGYPNVNMAQSANEEKAKLFRVWNYNFRKKLWTFQDICPGRFQTIKKGQR